MPLSTFVVTREGFPHETAQGGDDRLPALKRGATPLVLARLKQDRGDKERGKVEEERHEEQDVLASRKYATEDSQVVHQLEQQEHAVPPEERIRPMQPAMHPSIETERVDLGVRAPPQ